MPALRVVLSWETSSPQGLTCLMAVSQWVEEHPATCTRQCQPLHQTTSCQDTQDMFLSKSTLLSNATRPRWMLRRLGLLVGLASDLVEARISIIDDRHAVMQVHGSSG